MAASDKRPSIYGANTIPMAYAAKAAVPSDTVYQPFKGFYVSGGGNVAYMDWDGNLNTLVSVQNGVALWISGQRVLGSTTAGVLTLFQ